MLFNKILRKYFAKAHFKQQVNVNSNYGIDPIIEGKYGISNKLLVPNHIPKPQFVDNPNPVYGQYSGPIAKHDNQTIQNMRIAGNLAGKALKYVCSQVKEGMTTDELDKLVHEYIISTLNAYPSCLGFMNFPKSVCTSVNDVLCHGIPDNRPLKNRDFVNFDVTLYINGVYGDTSAMVCVGDVHEDVKKLIEVTQQALYESIKVCKPGVPYNQIGKICSQIAHKNGFHVCDIFAGHGIGNLMHLPPVVHHQNNDEPHIMEQGHTFTIEPIFMLKNKEYYMWRDNFTVVSPNNPSAQWEHIILITQNGHEILTRREGEVIPV